MDKLQAAADSVTFADARGDAPHGCAISHKWVLHRDRPCRWLLTSIGSACGLGVRKASASRSSARTMEKAGSRRGLRSPLLMQACGAENCSISTAMPVVTQSQIKAGDDLGLERRGEAGSEGYPLERATGLSCVSATLLVEARRISLERRLRGSRTVLDLAITATIVGTAAHGQTLARKRSRSAVDACVQKYMSSGCRSRCAGGCCKRCRRRQQEWRRCPQQQHDSLDARRHMSQREG